MPDTITESELVRIKCAYQNARGIGTPSDRLMDAMRFALSDAGITVVPDPVPEPDEREAQGWCEAAEYASDPDAQDDFMTGWRTADRTRQVQITEATVDAAARAMAERFGDPPYLPWEDWGPLSQDEFRADARAALEAAEEVRRG